MHGHMPHGDARNVGDWPGHGGRRPHHPFGMAAHVHAGLGAFAAQRARRGDVRTAVLRLLAEEPMHGYQIIQELSARSGGTWNPSAGSVYPTLQMLADEGLVTSEESGGKKVFRLTEAGATAASEIADEPAPWDAGVKCDSGVLGYREAAGRLMQPVWQIARSGNADQLARATEILVETRKKLYSILAED